MVKTLLRKGLDAFASKQQRILTAAFFIAATTVISQILGLLKYRIMLTSFGPSSDLGVFFAAFRVPELVFQVLIVSAVSASFIPLFSEYLEDKRKKAFDFASSLLSIGFLIFTIISILIIIFARPISAIIAPGFSDPQLDLMANLTRIIMVSQLFFMFATVFTALLHSFQHFLVPGIANTLYNAGIIIGTLLFAQTLGIYAIALGTVFGAMLFAVVQLPVLLVNKYRIHVRLSINHGIKKVVPLMIPRALTIILAQIAITANVAFASIISARSIVIFDLAQVLMLAPVLLFGQSIAQATFPSLARKKNNIQTFRDTFLASFNQILYLTLPASALLIVLRIPLVRLLFGARQTFDWPATVNTGLTLAVFALSISAQALIYLLARAYYAQQDTKTPFYITLGAVILNIALSYIFIIIYSLPVYYLALSFSISQFIAFGIQLIALDRKINLPKLAMAKSITKITIAALIMGFALYIPIKLLDQLVFDTTRTINLLILTGIASVAGFTSYLFVTWLLDIRESYAVIDIFKRMRQKTKFVRTLGEVTDSSKLNP